MTIQDVIFSVCQWCFLLALLPSITGPQKPAPSTSLMTSTLLAIMAITFVTLQLWMSAISTALVAAGWFVLFYQRVRQ